MKTFLYALGALALVTSTAAQADGEGIKQQAESYAVQRGDYSATARDDRTGPVATVRLQRELPDRDTTAERAAAPRSDAWMFRSSRTDSAFGE